MEGSPNIDDFNPYTLDDPSIIALNSIDNFSANRREEEVEVEEDFKIAKRANRRRKK